MAPTSTGGVATDASAAANPVAEPLRQVAVPPDAWARGSGADRRRRLELRACAPPARSRGLRRHAGRHRALARMTPEAAVLSLVDYQGIENGQLTPFEHSGIYDPTPPLGAIQVIAYVHT
jgi:hypothetical protein